MKKLYGEHMGLLCPKGLYTYEWVDGIEKLYYDGIPPPDAFGSQLTTRAIYTMSKLKVKMITTLSMTIMNIVLMFKKALQCLILGDYHLTYLKCDVLLLSDVFENFRKHSFNFMNHTPQII